VTLKLRFLKSIWKGRELLWQLTRRDVIGRYRGSQLGLTWSLINPLLMLAVYTFVFSQVFATRWNSEDLNGAGQWGFALNLFAGLIVFNVFSECCSRAATSVSGNPNFVKKVVFPLELIGASVLGSALFHALTSLVILLFARLTITGFLPPAALLLPIIWMPLALGCLALSWFLAALGVFIRDTAQIMSVLISVLMFLSPIFYPLSAVPEGLRWLIGLNPLAITIEQTRMMLIQGTIPSLTTTGWILAISVLACESSFRLFKSLQPTFADYL